MNRTPKDLLLESIHVNDNEDLEGYAIIKSQRTRNRTKCITSLTPIKEILLESGWEDTKHRHKTRITGENRLTGDEITDQMANGESMINKEEAANKEHMMNGLNTTTNHILSPVYLRKGNKVIRFIKADPYASDYVIVNDGAIVVIKLYNSCQFMEKVRDATISSDIRILSSLAREPGFTVVILLEDMASLLKETSKGRNKTQDRILLANIKVAIVRQNIMLLESHTAYDTALLVCSFCDEVGLIEG